MRIGITLAMVLALGCGKENTGLGMGGGGTSTDVNDLNDQGDDNNGGSDTGGTYGDPPEITAVTGSWDESADPPRVLITIDVTDPDGDIHRGKVGIAVDGSVEEWFTIEDPTEDGASEYIEALYNAEDGQVEVTAELDEGMPMDVTLNIRVKDAASNVSDVYDLTPQ